MDKMQRVYWNEEALNIGEMKQKEEHNNEENKIIDPNNTYKQKKK